MLVALGVAVTDSEVTAALVEVDVPSLGPVDERITPLGASSSTVGEVVSAAIGVMRQRAVQNGLDLHGTVVSCANRAERESISAELKRHGIGDVDVVDATYLSPAFEPSVSTAVWNVDGVGRVARNPVHPDENVSHENVKPVKASRMEKFGMAHHAQTAEKALGAVGDNAENGSCAHAAVSVPDRESVSVETLAERIRSSMDWTSSVVFAPESESETPFSIAEPPAVQHTTTEPAPAAKPGIARSLDLGEDVVLEQVSGNGYEHDTRHYSGVSSHADTAETTVIDSAAIVAAVGAGLGNYHPSGAPVEGQHSSTRRRTIDLETDPYDSPMTEPINIVGPMSTRPAQDDRREGGVALIIAVMVALVLAGLLAIWAIAGAVKSPEPEEPVVADESSSLTSEPSAAPVPAQASGAASVPSVDPADPITPDQTDTGGDVSPATSDG